MITVQLSRDKKYTRAGGDLQQFEYYQGFKVFSVCYGCLPRQLHPTCIIEFSNESLILDLVTLFLLNAFLLMKKVL